MPRNQSEDTLILMTYSLVSFFNVKLSRFLEYYVLADSVNFTIAHWEKNPAFEMPNLIPFNA